MAEDGRIAAFEINGAELAVLSFGRERANVSKRLTASEQEVYALMRDGRSYKEIAGIRGVSVRTIGNQIRAIYRKLGICSRRELTLGRPVAPSSE